MKFSVSVILSIASCVLTGNAQENRNSLRQVCVVQSPRINENSGVAVSKIHQDAIWTHNDSGASPVVFLFSLQSGKTIAEVSLPNAFNRDWEDITTFEMSGTPYVLVADVGDNLSRRDAYQLCIFPERQFELGQINHEEPTLREFEFEKWKDLQFHYEDGSHNCEAIAVDSEARQVILVEKVYPQVKQMPGVYVIDLPNEKTGEPLVAKRVGDFPVKNVTGMDLSEEAGKLVVRSYLQGFLFEKEEGQSWAEAMVNTQATPLALPMQRQGEGVCFSQDGSTILLSSEFKKAPLWSLEIEDDQ